MIYMLKIGHNSDNTLYKNAQSNIFIITLLTNMKFIIFCYICYNKYCILTLIFYLRICTNATLVRTNEIKRYKHDELH